MIVGGNFMPIEKYLSTVKKQLAIMSVLIDYALLSKGLYIGVEV